MELMDQVKSATVFDSDQQQIGEIYANALVGLGQKSGTTKSWIDQLGEVVQVLQALPKLRAMLQSPDMAQSDKLNVLQKAFGGRIDALLLTFLKVVMNKGRFECLPVICSAAEQLFDDLSGRMRATITTAEPINDQVRKALERQLETRFGKTFELSSHVDSGVIGGMVIRIGDTIYDASVKNRLSQVRANAIQRASDTLRYAIDSFVAN